jgi:CMP-N-acetylneuraminic acid synthetase
VQGLWVMIAVGCEGRPAAMVRQTLGGRLLLDLAVRQAAEARPGRILVSVPDGSYLPLACACGAEGLLRPAGRDGLDEALAQVLDLAPAAGKIAHLLSLDPLLPLRGPGRLAEAVALARRERADCVFSCHRESALLWHRSPMGLVPYFDPARPPDLGSLAEQLPWLREDGGLYLLRAAAFARSRCRRGGRLVALETAAAEAVVADGPAGLAVCRALAAERDRAAAASAG